MTNQSAGDNQIANSDTPRTFSFWISLLTAILTTITFAIAIATPPLSGPFCRENCFEYPFLNIASRFPRDYIWMYPAIIITALYLTMFVCVNFFVQNGRKIFSNCGVAFAAISAAILILDYFIQISVIQPGLLKGESDGISILSQFNPHGIFIAMEELGFFMMSLSFLCFVPVFHGSRIELAIRWIFIVSFAATAIAFLLFSFFLGVHREYYFEVTAISINWLALISSSVLLSIHFKRKKSAICCQ